MKDKAPSPQKRNRNKTTGAILRTATTLFLERGYAAVSLSLIAKQAGVTKSLLHHYFGDKRGLWKAVKDASFASYAEQQRALFSAQPEHPEEGIAASLSVYFSFLKQHPEVARIFALESFERSYEPSATEQDLLHEGVAFLHDLQEKKILRKDIDADMMLAMFGGLTEYWFISRDRVAKLHNLKSGDSLDARYFEAASKIFDSGFLIQ